MRISVDSPEEMTRLGATIAEQLRRGDLVLLNGELGAGKTTLARGIGEALGVTGTVSSPTFVLARTHQTGSGVPLVHVDAYRLAGAAELDDLDIRFADSIVVVEWAGRMLDGVAESWLELLIERPHGGAESAEEEPRQVTVNGTGQRWADLDWVPSHWRVG